jgi:hypothetical protein
MNGLRLIILLLAVQILASGRVMAQETNAPPAESTNGPPMATTNAPSKVIDPQDGWPDVSGFLDTAYGFVPVVMPITEPAVGYGALGGLMFINRNQQAPDGPPVPPDIAVIGGGATANGTWALLGSYSAWWLDGQVQTKIAGGYGLANLSYHGLGAGPYSDHPIGYTLKPLDGLFETRYRLGRSPWLIGLGYSFAETEVSFSGGALPPGVNLPSLNSHVGGLKPVIVYDTRDNVFTPTRGIYADITGGLYDQALGGDSDFQTIEPVFIYYHPLAPKWTLGINTSAGFSFGDAPFYSRPSITLRGAPAREYQADNMAQIEAELRWQFWRRFSVVGFGGAGIIWNNADHFDNQRELATGGFGFRYEIAKKYGLHMGADLAFGRDGPVLYIQIGSAWFRP